MEKLTPVEYRAPQAAAIARVIETGEPAEFEKELIRKDGSRVPVALTVSMVRGDDGKPTGVAAIIRDITERRQAEAAMRQSEERYRRLVQVSPDGIFVMRGDRVMFSNGEGLRLLGAAHESQVLGRSLPDFIRPDDRASVQQRIGRIAEGQEQIPLFEQTFVKLDGVTVDVESPQPAIAIKRATRFSWWRGTSPSGSVCRNNCGVPNGWRSWQPSRPEWRMKSARP